jgi:hypothetical protein
MTSHSDTLADQPALDDFRLGGRLQRQAGQPLVGRAAGVDPIGDELDVGIVDAAAAPHER